MATHSSTLAWKIPWTEKPGRLQSMGLQRVRHDWVTSLSLFIVFWTVVLEKTLKSPLDCKEIQQSILKEICPEYSLEGLMLKLNLTCWKRRWCWERLKAGEQGDNRGWNGWMASSTQWTGVEQALGAGDWQGSLVFLVCPWGHKELDMTEQLNWTELRIQRKNVKKEKIEQNI